MMLRIFGLGVLLTATACQCPPEILSGNVLEAVNLGASCSEVEVKGTVFVLGGGALTIERGTTLTFETGGGLVVDGGRIDVRGTQNEPVLFTHAELKPGSWQGLTIRSGDEEGASAIENLIVQSAGSLPLGETLGAGVTISPRSDAKNLPTFERLTVTSNQGYGLLIERNGIQVSECAIDHLTATQNSDVAVLASIEFADCLRGTVTLDGNGEDLIVLYGNPLTETVSIPATEGARFAAEADVTLFPGQELLLEDGASLLFRKDTALHLFDASVRGGALLPVDPDDRWAGVRAREGDVRIEGVHVDGAGTILPEDTYNDTASVAVAGASNLIISDTTLSNSASVGLRVPNGAALQALNLRFADNARTDAVIGWPAISGLSLPDDASPRPRIELDFYQPNDSNETLHLRRGAEYFLINLLVWALRIDPGVTLRAQGRIMVRGGGITAEGTPTEPIILTSQHEASNWDGLRIGEIGAPVNFSSVLSHVTFMNGGGRPDGPYPPPALAVTGGMRVAFDSVSFLHNSGTGLELGGQSVATGCSTLVFEGNGGPDIVGESACAD